MSRRIYLITYNSPLFPAHWAFFIPKTGNESLGDILHVTGDVRTGFQHSIKRNYDPSTTGRKYRLTFIAEVDGQFVKDYDLTSEFIEDAPMTPIDRLEEVLFSIPAPGPSLRSRSAAPNSAVEQLNCQWWIKQCVQKLIDEGICSVDAAQHIAAAPVN